MEPAKDKRGKGRTRLKPFDKLSGKNGIVAWDDLPKEPMPETKLELCQSCQGIGLRTFGRIYTCSSCSGIGWEVVLPKAGSLLKTEHEALAFCGLAGDITISYGPRHFDNTSKKVTLAYKTEQADITLRGPSLLWVVNQLITLMSKADKYLFVPTNVELED